MKTRNLYAPLLISCLLFSALGRAEVRPDAVIDIAMEDDQGNVFIRFKSGGGTHSAYHGNAKKLLAVPEFEMKTDIYTKNYSSRFYDRRYGLEPYFNPSISYSPAKDDGRKAKLEITCGKTIFTYHPMSAAKKAEILKKIKSGKTPLISLPKKVAWEPVAYLHAKDSKDVLYIDRDQFDPSPDRYRLHYGVPGNMTEKKIKKHNIQSGRGWEIKTTDGTGYWDIETTDGEFFRSRDAGKGLWNGKYLLIADVVEDMGNGEFKDLGITGVPAYPESDTPCNRVFPVKPEGSASHMNSKDSKTLVK